MMLSVKNLKAEVDGKEILKGLDLDVGAGEVHAIMGPNGSGKSTFAHVLSGRNGYDVTGGEVLLDGDDLLGLEPEERAAREADAVESELEALANIDRAFARAALADEMQATAPQVGEEGILRLPLLRHPELPTDRVVPNDMQLGEGFHVLVVSGPNAGGKTVAMKALALAALGWLLGTESGLRASVELARGQLPGTLTIDVTDDGMFYVHWLNVTTADEEEAAQLVLRRFEWFIRKIFE